MNTFHARLRRLGFSCYGDYLKSPHWKAKREEYRASSLPQECLGCGFPYFQLHHRCYSHIGAEPLTDLIPLCDECHGKVHRYLEANKLPVSATRIAFRRIFKLTKGQTRRRFQPFGCAGGPLSKADLAAENARLATRVAELNAELERARKG